MHEQIISAFLPFMMERTNVDKFEQQGKSILASKIDNFVRNNEPIRFSSLGYPMKSPNDRDKVLGKMPDLAEELSVINLMNLNNEIKKVYEPGINVTVICDGYVFNDILGVSDYTVASYEDGIRDMMSNEIFNVYNAGDFYSKSLSWNTVRDKINAQFGISEMELERRILTDANVNFIYRGIIRFLSLDLAINNYSSGNQLHKAAKKVAREMMFRNESYSSLIKSEFSDHIRLSIHPSDNGGEKFSFKLINSPKAWTSPWHCAIMVGEDAIPETVHIKDVPYAEIVYKNNQPYYLIKKGG